jgi:hypothetical protein
MDPTSHSAQAVPVEAPLEQLGLSVRARNALKGVGCTTIADVLRLDLERPVRGLGKLAREELLVKLERAGLSHPSEPRPANDIAGLEHALEKLEQRIHTAFGALSKEVHAARHKLRRIRTRAR